MKRRAALVMATALLITACGTAAPVPGSTAPPQDAGAESGAIATDATTGAVADTDPARPDGATPPPGPDSAQGSDGPAGADSAQGADTGGSPVGPVPSAFIPRPRGVCPNFAPGLITVRPSSNIARQARVWMSEAAATRDGPLVFYWYGTNGTPAQAEQALGRDAIAAIVAQGGLVVAPVHDPAAGVWPWFLVAGTQDFDLQVADELLACAIATVGVDQRRIHSVGFSAGAIQTVQMSYRRSGYLASVVTYSGAKAAGIPDQNPGNKFAALIFHGGSNDRVVVSFQEGSVQYKSDLGAAGRFSLICNHGRGHQIPPEAATSAWPFLRDHPLGTNPSPYAQSLPASVPAYCQR